MNSSVNMIPRNCDGTDLSWRMKTNVDYISLLELCMYVKKKKKKFMQERRRKVGHDELMLNVLRCHLTY